MTEKMKKFSNSIRYSFKKIFNIFIEQKEIFSFFIFIFFIIFIYEYYFGSLFSNKNQLIKFTAIMILVLLSIFLAELLKLTSLFKRKQFANSGFVYYDMPEGEKKVFIDLLLGFEEFAKIKGYNISFSLENSEENKIGFKFIAQQIDYKEGHDKKEITDEQVKDDLKDYYSRVKSKKGFDDIPEVIPFKDHLEAITKLNARINLMEFNYKLAENLNNALYKVIDKISKPESNNKQNPLVIIQIGDKNVSVKDSNNVVTGNDNSVDISGSIDISNDFSIRKSQIEKIDELIKIVKDEIEGTEKFKDDMIECLNLLGEELNNKNEPSKNFVFEKLKQLQSLGAGLIYAHHFTDAMHWLFDSFKYIG